MNDNLSRVAAAEGIVMSRPETRANSHLALVAELFARDHGQQEPFRTNIFAAYWQQHRNIGLSQVVLDVARESGLDATELAHAIDDGRYEGELVAVSEEAHRYGINGTPSFIIGRYLVVRSENNDH